MRPHLVLCLIAAVLSLIALGRLPYGYFTLLRWVVTAVSLYVAVLGYRSGQKWSAPLFALLAIVFNPLVPLHLSRGIWRPLDVSAAVLMLMAAALVRIKDSYNSEVSDHHKPI